MENKKYIKDMQRQIIDLKKYIVKLENKIETLNLENEVLITILFNKIKH